MNIKIFQKVMALHYQRGWDELEEPSDVHCLSIDSTEPRPTISSSAGDSWSGDETTQCTGSFVVG